jgi:hypothetical protein
MAENEAPFELVRKSMLAIYAAPSVREHFVDLARHLNTWDELGYEEKESQGIKIFEDLQSLTSFLENKGLSSYADEIFRLILHTFPEKYFPSLPWLKDSQNVDLRLLEDAGFVLQSRNYPDHVQEAFRLFEEQFKQVLNKLPVFSHEVEMNLFKEEGSGMAGEMFRRFAKISEKLHETSLKDIPWTLINQLAMKLNNSLNAFNAAYLLLKGLDEITLARPSRGLRNNMYRNEKFFLRNFYWKNIDQAQANKDYTNLVFFIDKFIPLADTGYERSNLLMIREKALKNINEIPKGLVTKIFIVFGILIVVSILLSEPAPKQRLNLQRSREKILSAKKGMQSPTEKRDEEKEPKVYYVTSRTGLIEKKPPVRPHNRDLDLYEIRHAVFQKMRLDYLAEQNLSPEEREKYQVLLEDYNSRCEFYKYKSEDREKVHWDGKINAPRIIQDAQDILASWRPENKQEEIARLVENELLSLNNPIHVQHIVGRLQLYGYYHGQVLPESWNDEASRALLDFKVSNLGVVDSKWDRKTQKALFGK